MLRYLTTVKLFGGAAVILTLALHTDPASARTFTIFVKNTTETQVFVGATVCLGHSSTSTEYGSKNTDNNGSVTFTGVSTLSIYIDVVSQGVGSHQFVWPAGSDNITTVVTLPGNGEGSCPAPPAGGTTTTTLAPAPGAQPSPGIVFDRQRAAELILKANYFQQALYPVYSHPRCVNCHGRVDPPSGRNHPQTSAACSTCHSVQGWTNAGAPSFWSGSGTAAKSWQDICNAVKNHPKSANRNVFLDHVQNDRLIGWALAPTPIAGNPARPAAPGGRNAFIANSLRWFDEGMRCGLQQGPFPFRR